VTTRLKTLGILVAVIGIAFLVAGGYAYIRTMDGQRSLTAFSAAQDVQLSYNADGQLVDRGETAEADAIMALLTEDWGYPVNAAEMDPNDPVVNTASEYMYQMATISYHVLNGTQSITLAEDVTYNGETFLAGTYEVAVDGKYYSQFDRSHPLDGPTRGLAWSATALGLIGQLGVGAATASALQIGLGLAAAMAAIGLTLLFLGGALVWVTGAESSSVRAPALRPATGMTGA